MNADRPAANLVREHSLCIHCLCLPIILVEKCEDHGLHWIGVHDRGGIARVRKDEDGHP
jgi:hypothetical protein